QVLRHPGYNVAYWNLAHRPLGIDDRGRYTAAGQEIAFFHFSGIDPHDPELLSKHQTRFSEGDLGPFRLAYRKYLQSLLGNGYDRYSMTPYAFGTTRSGAPIVPEMRQVFRRRYDIGAPEPTKDPFGLGPDAFDKPSEQLSKVSPRISMLLYEAWKRRDLLKESFDMHSREGREGLLAWYTSIGERVVGVGPAFVEGSRRELERYRARSTSSSASEAQAAPVPLVGPVRRKFSAFALRAFDSVRQSPRMRRLYYRLPPQFRATTHRALLRAISKLSLWSAPDFSATAAIDGSRADGLNLVGYFRGEFSIGECARAFAQATLGKGPPVALLNFAAGPTDRMGDRRFDQFLAPRPVYPVNLCFVNADQTPVLFDHLGSVLRNRYNIGYWFWELEKFPAAWQKALSLVDEVWVGSSFVQRAVSEVAGPKPVRLVPYPIDIRLQRRYARAEFGLAEEPFTFVFNFDYFSFIERKNPAGLVRAFKLAFPRDRDVTLVMKSTGDGRAPEAAAQLRRLAAGDPRIVFLDRHLDRESMLGLLSVADAYVSLHRSEGLGLGLAESMFLGKPAIATAYSGNLDFMNNDDSCLVDFRLVDVPANAYPHAEGQHWAEPDLDSAAHWMRRIREDAEFRTSVARRGQEFVHTHMSEASASAAIAHELERIVAALKSRAA
ncbi:MAG TPA: glycosyltransferase, partial [Burkholderiales bacterium]|nr:glycosyltransferase [Burkholderiales bacterium]